MPSDLQFVIFRVDAQSYALPITAVREIVRVPEITPVPQSPAHVAGVMNLRGRIVPVIDRRKSLQPTSVPSRPGPGALKPDAARILVLARDGKPVGMLVDSASEVLKIDSAQIEPAPKLFGDSTETYVTGVAKYQGRIFILLNVNTLLTDPGPVARDAGHLASESACD